MTASNWNSGLLLVVGAASGILLCALLGTPVAAILIKETKPDAGDWLQFSGAIFGGAITLIAAISAWISIQKQISIQQSFSSLEILDKSRQRFEINFSGTLDAIDFCSIITVEFWLEEDDAAADAICDSIKRKYNVDFPISDFNVNYVKLVSQCIPRSEVYYCIRLAEIFSIMTEYHPQKWGSSRTEALSKHINNMVSARQKSDDLFKELVARRKQILRVIELASSRIDAAIDNISGHIGPHAAGPSNNGNAAST
ncbi:hypothetical protein [Xanthobacter wiegelii]|uniref:hypothetical protein n=1 Tax=Xanthobacter wiegelii TaxID=3119913 RepID=UPI00372C24A7